MLFNLNLFAIGHIKQPSHYANNTLESILNNNDFIFENTIYKDIIDKIINFNKSPKITYYSELESKHVVFDLDELNKRVAKLNKRLQNNIIYLSEYNVIFEGNLHEIDKFISVIIYDNEVKFSILKAIELKLQFENIYNKKELSKIDIYKDIYKDNENIICYTIKYDKIRKIFRITLGN